MLVFNHYSQNALLGQ